MHVLSTPPAFVLSQDQTLQQKIGKSTPTTKKLPKESQPVRQNLTSPGYKSNWHWLIKHPVEFSKNNHTPSENPTLGALIRGISFNHTRRSRAGHFYDVTRWFPPCQTAFCGFVVLPSIYRAPLSDRLAPGVSWVSAGRPLRSPASSPVSLPVVLPYPVGSASPNPPPDGSGAPPGPGPMESTI